MQPSSRLNEVQGWIKSGLKDFSISRAAVDWGIRVPNDHKQTIYVWFDALLGYVSALLDNEEPAGMENAVASGWPASLHLIGKWLSSCVFGVETKRHCIERGGKNKQL